MASGRLSRSGSQLAGLALGATLGAAGIVTSLAATLAGPVEGRSMRLVAFAPWSDPAQNRAALWRAGLPIAAELRGGAFLIDGSAPGTPPGGSLVFPIRTGSDWGCGALPGADA